MGKFASTACCLAVMLFPASAFAIQVSWTDWQTSPSLSSASGQLAVGATTVDVNYSATSNHAFVQTAGGTNYWISSTPYTSGIVDNAPPDSDIVALNLAGTVTVMFSEAVEDPFLGLVSWNGNTVEFGVPIEIISFGAGFWGNGTPMLNGTGTGFFGSGEVHGVIRLPGSYTSISFTHTSENWHGFTVGVAGLADENGISVPEPTTLLLMGLGLAGLGFARRRLR